MRRMFASAAVVLATAALLSCGGGTEPKAATAPKAATQPKAATEPRAWTDRVCQALAPWRGEIAALNAQASARLTRATSPAQARDSIIGLLDGARKSTESARSRVAAAGVPDVRGGEDAASRLLAALAGVRDAYVKAQRTIGGLRIDPADAFYSGVASAMGTLNGEYAQAGVDTAALGSAELTNDFSEASACRTSG